MITQDELKSIVCYDPYTGVMTWKRKNKRTKQGDVIGSINNGGYLYVQINLTTYLVHRLAWLYMTGSFPKHEIDHIDRCRSNNVFSNLRECDDSQNKMNCGTQTNNRSGFKGVSWHKRDKKWAANIKLKGRIYYLGSFDDIEDAKAARNKAAKEMHGEFFCE